MDFNKGIVVQCVECAEVFNVEDCDEISYATSSVRCPFCGRWNYADQPDFFEEYIDEVRENDLDDTPLLYDFRTGKIEEGEFPDYLAEQQKKFAEGRKRRREGWKKGQEILRAKREQRLKEEAEGIVKPKPKKKYKPKPKSDVESPFVNKRYKKTASRKKRKAIQTAYYRRQREKEEKAKLEKMKREKQKKIKAEKRENERAQDKLIAQLKKELEKAGL
jgi:hypothetical protein